MALIVNYYDQYSGYTVNGAYLRILPFLENFDSKNFTVNFALFKDEASRRAGKAPIPGCSALSREVSPMVYEEYFSPTVKDLRECAYIFLKSLPEFADAIDA